MNATTKEQPIWIDCSGARMLGIAAMPADGVPRRRPGVLIAVGGPQYRVGSHRQFTLLARRLAARGYPSLRFDFRGMGDSDGDMRSFEDVKEDLQAAISTLHRNLHESDPVVIWAMCDAASAALMFCAENAQVAGMVLVNPWARGEASYVHVTLKHYYGGKLTSRAFWKRLLSGEIDVVHSVRDLLRNLRQVGAQSFTKSAGGDFRAEMARGLRTFHGSVLLMISGNDLTAREFLLHAESDPHWHGVLERPRLHLASLPAADHTFSTAEWRAWAEDRTLEWLDDLVL